MDIFFHCDKCGQHIVIDEASAGQLVDCPKCGKPLEVPHTSVAPVAVPRAPSAPPPAQRSRNKLPFAIRLLIVALTVACVTLATVFILLAKSRTGKAGSTAALADGKIDGEAFIVTKGAESIKALSRRSRLSLTDHSQRTRQRLISGGDFVIGSRSFHGESVVC